MLLIEDQADVDGGEDGSGLLRTQIGFEGDKEIASDDHGKALWITKNRRDEVGGAPLGEILGDRLKRLSVMREGGNLKG